MVAKKSTSSRRARTARAAIEPSYLERPGKNIWLTFDDGPHPAHTDRILKILAKNNIRATFFVVGENVRARRQLVKRAFDQGHRIGNHSYTHPNLTRLNEQQIRDQIARTDELIQDFIVRDKLFRPPYGAHNARVDQIVAELGYRNVLWNVDTADWDRRNQPDKWVQVGLDLIRTRDDCRVLNHDIHATTADHLEMFIYRIRQIGNVTFKAPSTL